MPVYIFLQLCTKVEYRLERLASLETSAVEVYKFSHIPKDLVESF